MQFADIS